MMSLNNQLIDILRMSILLNYNNANYINSVLIIIFSILISNEYLQNNFFNIIRYYSFIFNNNKIVILEGKRCFKTSDYNTRSDQLFSDRFKAVWYYSINSISNNETIYEIKEYSDSCNIYDEYGDYCRRKKSKLYTQNNKDFFIVHQNTNFRLTNNIWCRVTLNNEKIESSNNKKNTNANIETIQLEIFSSKLSLYNINNFIDEITSDYIKNIQNDRIGKKFIYTYIGKPENVDDFNYDNFASWEECEFNSSRRFNNLFFENKSKLIDKIKFFNDNKDWYDNEGHPYTLGIGLYGTPGTGKTSIIKCLANMLDRNIIIIPLNKIKTQRELSNAYFESTYNRNNQANSINFDNKIIVFEDIDCMTNIVKKRIDSSTSFLNDAHDDDDDVGDDERKKLIKKLIKNINNNTIDKKDIFETCYGDYSILNKNDDKLTLSYLLNLIDGIRETPGRIIVITSNYYEKLDDALIRPGRIDCTLEMKNASFETINSMFKHYYKMDMSEVINTNNNYDYELLKNYYLSPAEIVNIRVFSNTPEEFIHNLFLLINSKI